MILNNHRDDENAPVPNLIFLRNDEDNHDPSKESTNEVLGITTNNFLFGWLGSKIINMSLQERSKGLNDIHGVAIIKEQNPEIIKNQYLSKMNKALAETSMSDDVASRAYMTAMSLSPEYVEKMKIPFLKAEEYNSQRAAERMVRFFDRKMELFGDDMLVQDIKLNGLSERENEAFLKGMFQILPCRDQAGRAILFIHGALTVLYDTITVMRLFFYVTMSELQDEETLERGVVLIYYGIGQKTGVQGRPIEYSKNWMSYPWRVRAFHCCFDSSCSSNLHPFLLGFCQIMEDRTLCRMRFHEGNPMECFFKLMTFGIPRECLPMDIMGNIINMACHCGQASSRKHGISKNTEITNGDDITTRNPNEEIMDNTNSPSVVTMDAGIVSSTSTTTTDNSSITGDATILFPGPMDILMGRGRKSKSHPGVFYFHKILHENKELYERTGKYKKARIVNRILKEVKSNGCRFLEGTPDGYKECSDIVARKKISHGFRNLRLKHRDFSIAQHETLHTPNHRIPLPD